MYGYDNFYYNQKHKVFISFYHHDDQKYKETLEYLFGNTVINKSVSNGEYQKAISHLLSFVAWFISDRFWFVIA